MSDEMSDLVTTAMVQAAAVSSTEVGTTIQTFLTNFIGPILLIVIGVIAIKFLMQRQMTQFFQFLAVAILVAVLFFTPGLIAAIAKWAGSLASTWFA